MRRMVLTKPGLDNLVIETTKKPLPDRDEILVRLQAAALNYVDLAVIEGIITTGHHPLIPVADGAGVVESVGDDVRGFEPGDLVSTVYIPPWHAGRYRSDMMPLEIRPGAGLTAGQLSEYKTFKVNEVMHVPSHLSATEAATLPIAGVTAWNALSYGDIKPGQTVLIHGTGGVAIFGLQFAKLFGARVIITSSSDQKLEQARNLGADCIINYKAKDNLSDEILRATGGEGVDLVVETVGGPNLQISLESLRPQGHISVVGFLSGVTSNLNLIELNLKRSTLTGVSVGSREDYEEMLAAVTHSMLRPIIGAVFPFEKTFDAFAFLKSGQHFGKVVITL
ncbi:MAG: NAD(P)-dependent alcohol dehydrogenase [Candidatus Thiodiazotropha taylori]